MNRIQRKTSSRWDFIKTQYQSHFDPYIIQILLEKVGTEKAINLLKLSSKAQASKEDLMAIVKDGKKRVHANTMHLHHVCLMKYPSQKGAIAFRDACMTWLLEQQKPEDEMELMAQQGTLRPSIMFDKTQITSIGVFQVIYLLGSIASMGKKDQIVEEINRLWRRGPDERADSSCMAAALPTEADNLINVAVLLMAGIRHIVGQDTARSIENECFEACTLHTIATAGQNK